MDSLPVDYVPELRKQPPWLMEEMVAAEPGLVRPILANRKDASAIAELVTQAADRNEPVVITGCGTSETAAMAAGTLLRNALDARGVKAVVDARQALEAALNPWANGICLGISHEGGTRATIIAMEAARAEGAQTALLTARPDSTGTRVADRVFVTPLIDRSWCHTVGYLSPILAGAAIAECISPNVIDPASLESVLNEVQKLKPVADQIAGRLGQVERIVIVGSGRDRSPARELALKIEEGVRKPARMLDIETLLHGHMAACDERTGVIAFLTHDDDRLLSRTTQAIKAARRIGMSVAAILAQEADQKTEASLTDAGRMTLPSAATRLGLLGTFAAAALSLQRLTLALAARNGTNPDLIRREQEPYREAAKIAEGNW